MVELATTLGEYPETTVDDIHNDDILRVQVSQDFSNPSVSFQFGKG